MVSVPIFHFFLSYRYLKLKVSSGQFLDLLVTLYFSKYSIPFQNSLCRKMLPSAAVCGIQCPAAVIYQTWIFHLTDTKNGMTESKSEGY